MANISILQWHPIGVLIEKCPANLRLRLVGLFNLERYPSFITNTQIYVPASRKTTATRRLYYSFFYKFHLIMSYELPFSNVFSPSWQTYCSKYRFTWTVSALTLGLTTRLGGTSFWAIVRLHTAPVAEWSPRLIGLLAVPVGGWIGFFRARWSSLDRIFDALSMR
jgi:hypothetical protein